jgi:transposase
MEKRQTIEAIKLTPEEQWFLRKTIVKLHLKGFSAAAISNMLDAKTRHVQSTIKKYKDGGWEAVSLKTMGRPAGSNKTLIQEQEETIKNQIVESTPEQHGLKGFLWDMRNSIALVLILFNITISRSTMSEYFTRWGYTPQRPVIKNYKQNPLHIQEWLEVTYPMIKARASRENAEIFWGDETGIQNGCNYVRGYAPKGKTPEAKVSSENKIRINMMSAITNQGKLRFMLYEGKMNQQRMINFLRRLINSNERKVYIILDNLSVHHGKILKAWVEKHKDRIEIFYLPSYAPDKNPNEFFNGTLKREVVKHGNAKNKKELISNVRASAMTLQRDKKLLINLFNAEPVNYAS